MWPLLLCVLRSLFACAEEAEDLEGDVAVFLGAAEVAGVGAEGEERDHHRGMASGAEDGADEAGLVEVEGLGQGLRQLVFRSSLFLYQNFPAT